MTRIDLLQDTRLFAGCTDQDLALLGNIAEERTCKGDEPLFSQGEEARALMIIASGKIELEVPVSIFGELKNLAFETKGRGDVVGWSALVPPYRFTLSGRASDGTSVVAFPRADLIALFESDPGLGFRLMRNIASIVAHRLQHTQVMWAREIQRALDERYR